MAAIAIPVFLNQRKKAVDASIKSDLKNAAVQVETWSADFAGSPIVATTVNAVSGAAAAPDGGTAGRADLVTDTAIAGFKSSPGNTVKILPSAGNVGGYCLFGWNPGASVHTAGTVALRYDSQNGGLVAGTTNAYVAAATACP